MSEMGHSRRFGIGRESAHPHIPDIWGARFIRRDVPLASTANKHSTGTDVAARHEVCLPLGRHIVNTDPAGEESARRCVAVLGAESG